jgi:glycosyltransferase involved in cell wall biosynthesis
MTVEEKSDLRNRLNIPNESFLLLYTGRIVTDKGVNELISAYDTLSKTHSHIHLLLVGDYENALDPIHTHTQAVIHNHPHIHAVAFQSDIRPYFCIADLLLLPSYREGLPNVLIEAGSCGLPLIATNINGCNEVIIEGENGLLIPPKDVIALTNAIQKLLDDLTLYTHLKSNARDSIVRRYDQFFYWEQLHHKLDKLLNNDEKVNV